MAESSSAVGATTTPPPSNDARAAQFQQSASLANSTQANSFNEAAFRAGITPAANFNAAVRDTDEPQTPEQRAIAEAQAEAVLNTAEGAGLVSLSTPALTVLNEFSVSPRDASLTGNLTSQQLQDIAVLQDDLFQLEAAGNLNLNAPLTDDATTVDLSADADVLAELAVPSALAVAARTLSQQQLQQIGTTLAPLAEQPLTQPLFLQIQASVAAAGINPAQFSLRTILTALHYVAGLMPAPTTAQASASVTTSGSVAVAPVAPVSPVAGDREA